MKSLKYLQTLFNTTTTINHETGKEIHPPLPEIKKIYPGNLIYSLILNIIIITITNIVMMII